MDEHQTEKRKKKKDSEMENNRGKENTTNLEKSQRKHKNVLIKHKQIFSEITSTHSLVWRTESSGKEQ